MSIGYLMIPTRKPVAVEVPIRLARPSSTSKLSDERATSSAPPTSTTAEAIRREQDRRAEQYGGA